jgi:4-amino-4-deoxy-L-arabinose transferase-like glycosyltransferase
VVTDASTRPLDPPIARRTWLIALAAILAIALVIRLAAALHYDLPPQTDAFDYDRTAVSLANGDGYPQATVFSGGPGPSAFRPPAYPLFLAGVYALTGTSNPEHRWEAGRIAQALLGVAIVALVMVVASQLFGPIEALIAGAIAAIYPPLIYAGTSLLTEPLFTALLLGGIAAILRHRGNDPRIRWLVLAGLCSGLATLARTNGVIVIALLALGAWTLRPRFQLRSLAAPAIVIATAALTIAPWTIRNAIELHAFVPVSTQTGVALAGQYNETAATDRATWVAPYDLRRYCPILFKTPRCPVKGQGRLKPRALGEVEVSSRFSHLAKEFALDHPGHVLAAGFWNTLRFLSLENPIATEESEAHFAGQPQGLADLSVYAFWLLVPIAIAGCFAPAARRIPPFIWLLPPLILISVMFVVATSRYRAPLEPIFVLLASCALAWLWRRVRRPAPSPA